MYKPLKKKSTSHHVLYNACNIILINIENMAQKAYSQFTCHHHFLGATEILIAKLI